MYRCNKLTLQEPIKPPNQQKQKIISMNSYKWIPDEGILQIGPIRKIECCSEVVCPINILQYSPALSIDELNNIKDSNQGWGVRQGLSTDNFQVISRLSYLTYSLMSQKLSSFPTGIFI